MTYLRALRDAWLPLGPSHPTLVTPEGTRTRTELLDRVRRAAGLLTTSGLQAGHRVALQCPRELAFLEVHLAALALGVGTLPMNPRYTAPETQYLLADARPALAVLPQAFLHLAPPETKTWDAATLRARIDAATPQPLPGIDTDQGLPGADTEALLGYTSGTTGRPKGAPLAHRHLLACVEALHGAWRWTPDDVLLHALPLFHIHGLVVAQHVALRAGATTVWRDGFVAEDVLTAARDHHATIFMGVPTFYHRLLQVDEPPALPRMRLWTSGSAPLPVDVHQRFEARFGARILERYGMTEIGIVLSNPYEGERVAGSVGFPLPGTEVRIVDPVSRAPLPPDEVGEVCIRGPSVFGGYLHRPDATAAALVQGWMHTGDLGRMDAEGRVFLQGRRNDLILVGGFNVYPMEVETVLRAHPGVADAAVLGVDDADLGQRVVAHVELRAPVAPDDLRAHVREQLAAYKVPSAIVPMPSLPRNAMGKVLKNELRQAWRTPVVRHGSPTDVPRIVAANLTLAATTEDLALDPATVHAGVTAALSRSDTRVFVIELAGHAVGHVLTTTEWSDWRNAAMWWLQSLWIDPAWRRRGLGRHLLDAVRQEARRSHVPEIRLYVAEGNGGARAAYAAWGFADHGQVQLTLPTGGQTAD